MAYPTEQDNFYPYSNPNIYGNYVSDGSIGTEDSNFWSSSPRSDSPSPNPYFQNSYPIYKPINYASEHLLTPYKNGYSSITLENTGTEIPFVRVVKRRTTANKKERRRTMSINNAYADLRECIPNVPQDTKLSKIKTLRLATSYISYLARALESDNPTGGFRAELGAISRRSNSAHSNENTVDKSTKKEISEDLNNTRKAKGRTGWPQHVWALELKQEQTL